MSDDVQPFNWIAPDGRLHALPLTLVFGNTPCHYPVYTYHPPNGTQLGYMMTEYCTAAELRRRGWRQIVEADPE